MGDVNFTNLDLADDIAILSESLETLIEALDAFTCEVKPLSLEVSSLGPRPRSRILFIYFFSNTT